MQLVAAIKTKLYYRFVNCLALNKTVKLPEILITKKNLFIYFDYEREFGGHKVKMSDRDIYVILDLLDKYNLKTTWFTVGKIFEHYFLSINEILSRGHEIGSHTFSHIPPLNTSIKKLKLDFHKFNNAIPTNAKVSGFHSPNGKWSIGMIKYLQLFNFTYDIIYCKKSKPCNPLFVNYWFNKSVLRFHTMGDDWPIYAHDYTEVEILEYLLKLYDKVQKGNIAGIGFHPWVLISNNSILKGFELFLQRVTADYETNIKTASYFANQLCKEK